MFFKVENFRGIKNARGELKDVTIIGGKNGQGKSSVLQALAATLSGNAIPFLKQGSEPGKFSPMMNKKNAGLLVHAGQKSAKAKIGTDAEDSMQLSWPDCKHVAGLGMSPPKATSTAAGLLKWDGICSTSRSMFLVDLLKATPTDEDIRSYLSLTGVSEKGIQWAISSINKNGWDGSAKTIKESITEMKGSWRAATGEQWGASKAEGWRPDGWSDETATANIAGLHSKLSEEKEILERCIAGQAVGEEKKAQLNRTAASEQKTTRARKELQNSQIRLNSAIKAKESMEKPVESDGKNLADCPSCGKPVAVKQTGSGFSLLKPESVDQEKNKKLSKAIHGIDGKIQAAKQMLATKQKNLDTIKHNNKLARAAAEELKRLGDGSVTESELEAARRSVEETEKHIRSFQRLEEANKAHEAIKTRTKILDFLKPGGARHKKLVECLAEFNKEVSELSGVAGWPSVQLADDLELTLGGKKHFSLSDSEKYRAGATLQLAIARRDGSDVAIFDGAEILDHGGRGGLVKMLEAANPRILSIVGITYNKPSLMPDMEKHKLGASYWVDAGVMVRLREVG